METPINEKSSSVLRVTFYDDHDALVVPTSASYKIDDVESGTAIQVSTPIAPLASSVDIDVGYTLNRIINSARTIETRRVTVTFAFGVDKQGTGEYVYTVRNLAGVS